MPQEGITIRNTLAKSALLPPENIRKRGRKKKIRIESQISCQPARIQIASQPTQSQVSTSNESRRRQPHEDVDYVDRLDTTQKRVKQGDLLSLFEIKNCFE